MLKMVSTVIGIAGYGIMAMAEFQLAPTEVLNVWSNRAAEPGPAITLKAVQEQEFSRGLVRFDLSGLPVRDFGGVERALLRFQLTVVPRNLTESLEMAPLPVAWNSGASWEHSGITSWPLDVNRYANIDNPLENWHPVAPAVDGVVEVDVTNQVEDWLYCGTANNGWAFRIGKAVYGRPMLGPWEARISDLSLEIKLGGRPPEAGSLYGNALRVYPSALLPPVKTPYIFHLFNGSPAGGPEQLINSWNAWQAENATGARPENGSLPLVWCYGPQNPYLNSEAEFVNSYLELSKHALGIHVDEWQGITRTGAEIAADADPNRAMENKIAWSIRGILAAEKAHPACLIAVYWRGEDSLKPLTDAGYPDLVILEAQSHLNKSFPLEWGVGREDVEARARFARELGIIERTIPLFGFFENPENYHPEKILTIGEVEQWIRKTRERYPEMPGFAFYGSPEVADPNSDAARLLAEAEVLCSRYFIMPAPQVQIKAPRYGSEISSSKVRMVAEATGREGRRVQRYDWFADNCLLAQTAEPEFLLDCRMLEPGNHILTVHAVDSQWNRSAAQLPIIIRR